MAFTLSWSPLEVSMITGRSRVCGIIAQTPAHVVSGHVGHEDIEEHEVGVFGVEFLQSLAAGERGHRERVAVWCQHRLEQPGVLWVCRRRRAGVPDDPSPVSCRELSAVREHLLGKRRDIDGLHDHPCEPGPGEPVPVDGHHRCSERHHGDAGSDRIGAQLSEHRDSIHARQLDVHEDEVGRRGIRCQPNARLRIRGVDGAKAVVPQEIARELEILLIVFDDEDRPGRRQAWSCVRRGGVGHHSLLCVQRRISGVRRVAEARGCLGKVTVNVLPARQAGSPR